MATIKFPIENQRAWAELMASARKAKGVSQAQVAEEAGLSTSTLSSLERGPYTNMSLVDTVKLGRYYGISPNTLCTVLGLWEEEGGGAEGCNDNEARHIHQLLKEVPQDKRTLALRLIQNTLTTLKDQ